MSRLSLAAALLLASVVACTDGPGADPDAPPAADAHAADARPADANLSTDAARASDAGAVDGPGPVTDAAILDGPILTDAAVGVDATVVKDASDIDAPVIDAAIIDAPIIDAPVIDAPVIDAPVIDAPVIDAPVLPDAGPVFGDGGPLADAGAPIFTVNGSVSGSAVPASGQVVVVWEVVLGPDHLFVMGRGTSVGAAFQASFSIVPPPEALNAGLGVGWVILFPDGVTVPPEGSVLTGALPGMIGLSGLHAIIYKAPTGVPGTLPGNWPASFPSGYSCGGCVDLPTGADRYTPVSCSQVQINTSPSPKTCNWT